MPYLKYLIFGYLLILPLISIADLRIRPTIWAKPIIGSKLTNLYQVDQGLFRSEQPDDDAFIELHYFGIKSILNLREYHSDKREIKKLPLKKYHLKLDTGKVTEQDIIQALRIIQQAKKPILVHCWHGSDRTGAVIASYRIIFNQWTKQQAIDELINGGYGYHAKVYPNIIKLIQQLNIEKIKKALQ